MFLHPPTLLSLPSIPLSPSPYTPLTLSAPLYSSTLSLSLQLPLFLLTLFFLLLSLLFLHLSLLLPSPFFPSPPSSYFFIIASCADDAPMFTIPNVVFPVAEYFLEDILKFTRYYHTLCCVTIILVYQGFPNSKCL